MRANLPHATMTNRARLFPVRGMSGPPSPPNGVKEGGRQAELPLEMPGGVIAPRALAVTFWPTAGQSLSRSGGSNSVTTMRARAFTNTRQTQGRPVLRQDRNVGPAWTPRQAVNDLVDGGELRYPGRLAWSEVAPAA